MGALSQVQAESHDWRMRNFPDHTAMQQLAGMTEEMGEIAHAVLKLEQRIRVGLDTDKAEEAIADGLADWMIFACGLADFYNIDLECCLRDTWLQVAHRDWQSKPQDGVNG